MLDDLPLCLLLLSVSCCCPCPLLSVSVAVAFRGIGWRVSLQCLSVSYPLTQREPRLHPRWMNDVGARADK